MVSGGTNCKQTGAVFCDLRIERPTPGTVGQECSSSLGGQRQAVGKAATSDTTTDVQGVHEAKDAINAEAHSLPKRTKTTSKMSRSSTPRGFLQDDKADKAPPKRALWMRAANATRSTLQKALDDLENTVEQFEAAVKTGKGSAVFVSKSYITKMRGGGKALETWKTKVVNFTETLRDRPPLSCPCCNTLHA